MRASCALTRLPTATAVAIRASLVGFMVLAGAGDAASQDRSQGGPPTGWGTRVDGLYVYQGETDLSEGGEFSVGRAFVRGTALYTSDQGFSAGISLSAGRYSYDFGGASVAPWGDINDFRISVPLRFQSEGNATVFVSPSLRYDYEDDAESSDGETYGVFGGVAWRLNDRLTIGPAIGAFSELGSDDWDFFPALLVDWQIADGWRLSTAQAPGATQGPGVSLTYSPNERLSYGLTARYESLRFRLDDDGIAPGGVGEDSSLPVAFSVQYAPNPGTSLSAFVGAEFGGELSLEDENGTTVSRQDYDTAPITGVSLRLAF